MCDLWEPRLIDTVGQRNTVADPERRPIRTTLIDQVGWTVLLPVLAMGGAGQTCAALALWMRFR